MKPLEILLTSLLGVTLLAKAVLYPRLPRFLDALAVAAGVLAGIHLVLDGARALFVPFYALAALLIWGAVKRRGRQASPPTRGWVRRILFRFASALLLLVLCLSAGLVAVLTPLVSDADQIFSLFTSSSPDFSALSWTEAFESLHRHLQTDYAFGEWKRIDWNALRERFAPRVEAAEREKNRAALYLALREYAYSFPDGHVGLEGDDGGARAAAVGGGFGLGVLRLDDGSAMVHVLLPDGPAARAGVAWGARVLSWDGAPVDEAAEKALLVWADDPPATREGRRLLQYKLLPRAAVGSEVELVVSNPDESAPRRVVLKAEDDAMKALELSNPGPHVELWKPVVRWRMLPGGVGYLQILGEVPTLGGLFPHENVGRALRELVAGRAAALVLDVRGNHGGFDKLVTEMMGFFAEDRALYEKVAYNRTGTGFSIEEENTLWIEPREPRFLGRVAVLVDENTLSSGEGFPLLVRRLKRGLVVGWAGTHGSFGIYANVPLPEGLLFEYPHGRSLDGQDRIQLEANDRLEGGVEPDVRVPVNVETVRAQWLEGRDVALDLAVELLSRNSAKDN